MLLVKVARGSGSAQQGAEYAVSLTVLQKDFPGVAFAPGGLASPVPL